MNDNEIHQTETVSKTESIVQKTLVKDGKFYITLFLAGTGFAFWIYNMFFSPMKGYDKDIALIQQEISSIKENHLTHLQSSYETLSKDVKDIEKAQNDINVNIGKIMTKLDIKK